MNVIILGVDGMEPRLVDRYISEGYLPALEGVRNEGSYGTLNCSSLSSAEQWTTHFTGVSSDTHGITRFTRTGQIETDDLSELDQKRLINKVDIDYLTYLELLDNNNVKTGCLNPLPIWPPLQLDNGFCVSGMLTPPEAEQWATPASLQQKLEERDYKIDVRFGDRPYGFVDNALLDEMEIGTIHSEMFDVMEKRVTTIEWITEEFDLDVFYGLVKTVDIIQHAFWKHMTNDDPEYGKAIRRCYELVDGLVGSLRERFPEANIIIFSDHGFQSIATPPKSVGHIASAVNAIVPEIPKPVRRFYNSIFEVKTSLPNIDQLTGTHADPAIYLMAGPDIDNAEKKTTEFEDITPTILALAGNKIPRDYIGSPLSSVISVSPEFESINLRTHRDQGAVSDIVSNRLYNLGYAEMVDENVDN